MDGALAQVDPVTITKAERGYVAEDRCLKDLRRMGFWAHRAYASKGSHGFDVIAMNETWTLLVQVKRSKVPIRDVENYAHFQKDIAALKEIPHNTRAVPMLWVWVDTQAKTAKRPWQPGHWRYFSVFKIGLIEIDFQGDPRGKAPASQPSEPADPKPTG